MNQRLETSPLGAYREHLARGELGYQWDEQAQRAVFYPRVVAPGSGSTALIWRVSKGLGTVYATTVVHPREGMPYNVALIDIDEGFRMMSRVRCTAPEDVRIGMRVRMAVEEPGGTEPPYPVFDVVEAA